MSDPLYSNTSPPAAPPAEPGRPPRAASSGIWWGLVLVAVGALLLVNQFVPGFDAWRLWPFIIVILGLRSMIVGATGSSPLKRLAEGLSVVVVGAILLANSLGVIPWTVWWGIASLWPLLLVAAGIDVLGKATDNDWLRVLGSVVVIGGLLYGAFAMSATSPRWPTFITGESTPFSFVEPHTPGISSGSARIDGGVGDFAVAAGRDLVAAQGSSYLTPRFEVTLKDREADVRVSPGEGSWGPGGRETRLAVALSRDVSWDLRLNAGVSSFEFDLRELAIRRLSVDAGVSGGTITLGSPDRSAGNAAPVTIKTGVSDLTVRVPKGVGVRLTSRGGLTSLDTRGEWSVVSGSGERRVFESDGFDAVATHWDITIDSGVSSVTVEQY